MDGEARMSTPEQKSKSVNSARRLRLTLAISTPIAVWMIWLII
jgi:hypothetical protein